MCISRDIIIIKIFYAIVIIKATRQLAIILASVALWEIKLDKIGTVWEKSSRLRILHILS